MLLVQLFSSLFYCLKSHKSNSNYRTAVSEKPSTHCTLNLWKFTVQSPRHREKLFLLIPHTVGLLLLTIAHKTLRKKCDFSDTGHCDVPCCKRSSWFNYTSLCWLCVVACDGHLGTSVLLQLVFGDVLLKTETRNAKTFSAGLNGQTCSLCL